MNKKLEKAIKKFEKAIDGLYEANDGNANIIASISFFDEEGNCTDDSMSYYDSNDIEVSKTSAECLLEEISNTEANFKDEIPN